MLLRHKGYFVLKAIEKKQMQEGISDLAFLPKSKAQISHEKDALLYEEENILITRDEELTPRLSYRNKPTKEFPSWLSG